MGDLPPGYRQDIVTFRVRDGGGMMRLRGATEERAIALAESLLEESPGNAPFVVERVLYTAFTEVEHVKTFGVFDG